MNALDVTPRQRDSVRLSIARRGIADTIWRLHELERCDLDRLETRIALTDVRSDLDIARRHLRKAVDAVARIEGACSL